MCAVAVGWATPSLFAMNSTHTPSSTRSPSRWGGKCARGSRSHSSTCSRFGLASAAMTAGSSIKFSAGGHHRRAGDLDGADPVSRPGRARVQPGGTADLGALADLDRLAEGDPAVPGQVHGKRPGGGSGGGILGHAEGGPEVAEFPAAARAREAANPDTGKLGERSNIRLQRRHRLLAGQLNVDMPRPVAVRLHRQPGGLHPKDGEQFAGLLVALPGRNRLPHPAGDDPPVLPLELDRDDASAGFQPDSVQSSSLPEHERRAELPFAGNTKTVSDKLNSLAIRCI